MARPGDNNKGPAQDGYRNQCPIRKATGVARDRQYEALWDQKQYSLRGLGITIHNKKHNMKQHRYSQNGQKSRTISRYQLKIVQIIAETKTKSISKSG